MVPLKAIGVLIVPSGIETLYNETSGVVLIEY